MIGILLGGLGFRLFYLLHSFDWLVSFFPADDFFYYVTTAFNIAHGSGSSCDGGLTIHNGFHPLYLVLLWIPAVLGVGKVGLVYWGMGILVAATLAAVVLSYRIGVALGNPVMALCVPLALAFNNYFVRMSLSGFETALVTALFLALILAVMRRRSGFELGFWLGLVCLARLDAVVMAGPIAVHLAMERRWRTLGYTLGTAFFILLPWFAWSQIVFSSLLPLSGAAKMRPVSFHQFWLGFETFCRSGFLLLFGHGLVDYLPPPATYGAGLLIMTAAVAPWRRFGWLLLYPLGAFLMYTVMTEPRFDTQFIRYCVPALVILGILFFSHRPPARLLVPLVLLASLAIADYRFVNWATGSSVLPTFVGLGEAKVPGIIAEIAGEDDVVGCFDSGSIGYFSPRPVVNLDGLVNYDIVRMLRSKEGGSRAERYLRYFREKGITIMVGGTGFSWVNIFPDLKEWEPLHAPLDIAGGHQIIFLRIPGTETIPAE